MSLGFLIAFLAFFFVGLEAVEFVSGVLSAFAGDVAVFHGAINQALAFAPRSILGPAFGAEKKIRTPCTPWRRSRVASF
jgi:hypothetical protein